MSNSDNIEQQAAHFLMRRDEADWSAAEQASLEEWLNESMDHKAAFWRLEYGWSETDRVRALALPPIENRGRRRFGLLMPLAVAATLACAIIAGVLMINRDEARLQAQYATQLGQRGDLKLVDGSEVELNTNTRVRIAQTASRRQVWLDQGEAYFEVAHDTRRPFVVHLGDRTVTVLGTKFGVRRDASGLIVSVVSGRVRLDNQSEPNSAGSTVLTRGDMAIADGQSVLIASHALDRIERSLAWRNGMVNFDGSTLAEVATEFNRYNHRQLIIGDQATAAIRVGGSFQLTNIQGFARLLQRAYGLSVQETDQQIKISQN